MVADHKEEIEAKLNEKFAIFNPVEMTQQVVGGWLRGYDLLGCWNELSCEDRYWWQQGYLREVVGAVVDQWWNSYDRFGDVSVTEVLTGKTLADTLSPY